MKKTMLIAATVALTTCVVALAQSEVLSQNAVGYVKKSVPAAGGLAIVVHSLDSMDTVNVVFTNTSIADELPRGSRAFFWTGLTWSFAEKSTKTGLWTGLADKTLEPGEAFFLKTPATQLVEVVVTVAGEVPDSATLARTMSGSNNLTSAGNPYPVSTVFTNTALSTNLARGARVYFWTGAAWSFAEKSTKTGNWTGLADKNLEPGEGFFVKNPSNDLPWTVDKPYTWP